MKIDQLVVRREKPTFQSILFALVEHDKEGIQILTTAIEVLSNVEKLPAIEEDEDWSDGEVVLLE